MLLLKWDIYHTFIWPFFARKHMHYAKAAAKTRDNYMNFLTCPEENEIMYGITSFKSVFCWFSKYHDMQLIIAPDIHVYKIRRFCKYEIGFQNIDCKIFAGSIVVIQWS